MKTRLRLYIVIFCLFFIWAGFAHAQAEEWVIDKDHSNIYFDVKHKYVTVRGLFGDFSGSVVFDPEDADGSRVDFTVKVESIDTNIDRRDEHLRSADFFEVKTYPEMTFSCRQINHVQDNRYIMKGALTIKSVTKDVSIPFTYLGLGENPLVEGQKMAAFEADFTINRLEYNVGTGKFAEMGVVGKDVRILIALQILKDS